MSKRGKRLKIIKPVILIIFSVENKGKIYMPGHCHAETCLSFLVSVNGNYNAAAYRRYPLPFTVQQKTRV